MFLCVHNMKMNTHLGLVQKKRDEEDEEEKQGEI